AVMGDEIRGHIVIHPEAVSHLMRRNVPVLRWSQGHLAPSVGAAITPERWPPRRSPIGTGGCAVFGPVVREHGNLAVKSGDWIFTIVLCCLDRVVDQRRSVRPCSDA